MENKKILLVDDDADLLTHLSDILRYAHYEVISTTKGQEAVDLAKDKDSQPDLIILDIVLPDMDGGEVAYRLSRDPSTSGIPIVYLTGIIKKEEESSFKMIGERHVLIKPVSMDELLETIGRVLEV